MFLSEILKLSKALHMSLDDLVFGDGARGADESFKYQFEAISELDNDDKHIIREVLTGFDYQVPGQALG